MAHLPATRKVEYLGRWHVVCLVTLDTLRASVTARWTWPEGSIVTNPEAIVAWVGMYAGVTPTQAHFTLEPYAHRHAQGCYYSPIAQDAYNQLQARQCPLLTTTGGMPTASLFTPAVRLAARLSYPLGTTVQPPTASVKHCSHDIHWPLSHGCAFPPCLVGGHAPHTACLCLCPHGGGWHYCGHAPW